MNIFQKLLGSMLVLFSFFSVSSRELISKVSDQQETSLEGGREGGASCG